MNSYQVTISATMDVAAEDHYRAKVVAAEGFDFGSANYEVREPFDEDDEISIVWHIDDVKEQCNWLTDDQARDVLHNLKHKHNADIGINWDVIDITANILWGERT